MRPTWRCSAMITKPQAAPLHKAAKPSTRVWGHRAANKAPALATTEARVKHSLTPWRSTIWPAGNAKKNITLTEGFSTAFK